MVRCLNHQEIIQTVNQKVDTSLLDNPLSCIRNGSKNLGSWPQTKWESSVNKQVLFAPHTHQLPVIWMDRYSFVSTFYVYLSKLSSLAHAQNSASCILYCYIGGSTRTHQWHCPSGEDMSTISHHCPMVCLATMPKWLTWMDCNNSGPSGPRTWPSLHSLARYSQITCGCFSADCIILVELVQVLP